MYVQRGLKTNIIHVRMESIWVVMSMWGVLNSAEISYSGSWIVLHKSRILMVLQIKPILSMIGIIIVFTIRIRSYRYWMRLSRRSYGGATKTSYETILCSQYLWARSRVAITLVHATHRCLRWSRVPAHRISVQRPHWEDGVGLNLFRWGPQLTIPTTLPPNSPHSNPRY